MNKSNSLKLKTNEPIDKPSNTNGTVKNSVYTGKVIPLDLANVDTDAIIPKQFLQKISRDGFGVHLFHDWRYLDDAGTQPNPEFVLNKPIHQQASVLLARDNFGCGSSREHAPWALSDFGIKIIIAPSFADIFYANALNNQLVPVILSQDEIQWLFEAVAVDPCGELSLDLDALSVHFANKRFDFSLNEAQRQMLISGSDAIDLTLSLEKNIATFESQISAFMQ